MSALLAVLANFLPYIVTVVSPVVTSYVRKVVPKIPKPLIPLTSVAVGTVAGYATGLGLENGAIAGAVGVAVREVLDQVKKTVDAGA